MDGLQLGVSMNSLFIKLRWLVVAVALSLISQSVGTTAWAGQIVQKQIKIENEDIKKELNTLLEKVNELHSVCYKREEQKFPTALKAVINHIDRARDKAAKAERYSAHILKILNASKEQLEMAQVAGGNGSDRKRYLKEGFKQLTQLPTTFDLDQYRVFFCTKDKAVWFQKSWQAKNPIHPRLYKNCGKFVRQ